MNLPVTSISAKIKAFFSIKSVSAAILIFAFNTHADAVTAEDVDFFESGGNYYCYPWTFTAPPSQTPAPEGYQPFHLEHYGRHGSRWHIGNYNYEKPYELLKKAKDDGKLTPLGEEVYVMVSDTWNKFREGRDGELSDRGAIQHKGIGRRMVMNYPEIFDSTTNINARSTIVIRSILSMFNGLSGIQSLVPDVNVNVDASQADMWYMNYYDSIAQKQKDKMYQTLYKDFSEKHANKGEYLGKLFNDEKYAQEEIGEELFNPLFSCLVNAQSHEGQQWLVDKVFTPQEARERWKIRNANWFVQSGNSALTGNIMPFTQANLLYNIIESADSAMISDSKSVNLRYGHDTIVFPLATLLELNDLGQEINDLELLDELGWHDYLCIPMGANIQIVFYRVPGDDNIDNVLVKVLLNEQEASLPIETETAPYYKWTDFRQYYLDKLKTAPQSSL